MVVGCCPDLGSVGRQGQETRTTITTIVTTIRSPKMIYPVQPTTRRRSLLCPTASSTAITTTTAMMRQGCMPRPPMTRWWRVNNHHHHHPHARCSHRVLGSTPHPLLVVVVVVQGWYKRDPFQRPPSPRHRRHRLEISMAAGTVLLVTWWGWGLVPPDSSSISIKGCHERIS